MQTPRGAQHRVTRSTYVRTLNDGASLARRLERLRKSAMVVTRGNDLDRVDMRNSIYSPQDEAPRESPINLAYRVLFHCKQRLGLPIETAIAWKDSLAPGEGYVDPKRPDEICLPRGLLEPEHAGLLVYTLAHEAFHLSRIARGTLADLTYDAVAEAEADAFGRAVAASWR
jgi:hypothetical protein